MILFSQNLLQISQRQSRFHGDREVIHGMVDDPVHPSGAHGGSGLPQGWSPMQAGAQPGRCPRTAVSMQFANQRAQLGFAMRLQQRFREGLGDGWTGRAR